MFNKKTSNPNAKKKKMSPVVWIVLVGLVVGYLNFSILATGKTTIYYASQDIPAYTKVEDLMLQAKQVSKDAVPPNAITDKKEVVGKYTATDIFKGMAASKPQFLTEDKKSIIATQVPDGNIAMTVPVNNITGVHPNITTNERVNVYGFLDDKGSFLLFQNVSIVNVFKNVNNDKELSGVSLAVTPEEATVLNFFLEKGTIRLAVVPYDYKQMNIKTIDMNNINTDLLDNGTSDQEAQETQNNAEQNEGK